MERMKEGPNMHMTVFPNEPFSMGKSLLQWFVYCLVVAGFALALLQDSIWWGRNWGTTARHMFDGLVYAALIAGTFGWLWPTGA